MHPRPAILGSAILGSAIAVVAACAACAAAHRAEAAVVYDTISAASFTGSNFLRVGEYDPFPGQPVSADFAVSTRIMIAGDGLWQLTAIAARISRDGDALGAGRARIWISEATDGDAPTLTHELGTLGTTLTSPTTVGIEGLASLGVTLMGGHSYWVTMTAVPNDADPTRVRWYRSSLGDAGSTFVDDRVSSLPWLPVDGLAPGIKIGANAIPAPAVTAVLGLAGILRRRRR